MTVSELKETGFCAECGHKEKAVEHKLATAPYLAIGSEKPHRFEKAFSAVDVEKLLVEKDLIIEGNWDLLKVREAEVGRLKDANAALHSLHYLELKARDLKLAGELDACVEEIIGFVSVLKGKREYFDEISKSLTSISTIVKVLRGEKK